jgi:pyruvate,water dikinase
MMHSPKKTRITERPDCYVLPFREIDQTQVAIVGGKGANLGELARIEEIHVPDGFCVTTHAFRRLMAEAPSIDDPLDRLSRLKPDDRESLRTLSAEIRRTIEAIAIPADLEEAISRSVRALGERAAYAIRSSATAEDMPTASFAGQQDTYLNVIGITEILRHVSRCWASLFTERAVTYRLRNAVDHRKVDMAVVVQRMVFPQASGILFTADPVSGNRKVTSIDASFGLGEALVSGLVNADAYKVRNGKVVSRTLGTKKLAIYASSSGGTLQQTIESERQKQPSLTDAQIIRLEELGRRIEARFGCPQDIEWCLVAEDFQIVQSRPITTLFPIPVSADGENRVYISVGHQQMMTDPMKPLGLSFWQLTTRATMAEAGGRLFVDVTRMLASPTGRASLLGLVGRSDPLIGDALRTVIERGDFVPSIPDGGSGGTPPPVVPPAPAEIDPAIVGELIAHSEASLAATKRGIRTKSGLELFDFIRTDIEDLKRILQDPRSLPAIMTGMEAAWWLNEWLRTWLGEKNAADTLAQSVPNNVTSEMGLALLDVADAIRPHREVVTFLEHAKSENLLNELPNLPGGREAREALQAWLDKYGMRAVGEIDITRPRWSERPTALVPMILGNIKNFEPGAGARRFEQGRQEALKKEREVLERLRALPGGEPKARETKRMIDRLRNFAGYREYPKFNWMNRYFVYKQALMEEATRLVQAGVLPDVEDIFFLRFEELPEVVRTSRANDDLIRQRKEEFSSYQTLTLPRVLTSEGETVAGSYRRDDLPAGALVGLPVSAGTVEGRARVIRDIADANLEPGDILVTGFTDPSWTPLFVAIKGLVTEVGGLMTHGAVIAREYGLPAVVGVEQATMRIPDGARIRVHGTDGYIEIIGPPARATDSRVSPTVGTPLRGVREDQKSAN